MSSATPHEVIDRLTELLGSGPGPEMADLFSEDAVFEMPFQPPGSQEPGREAFRAHLAEAAGRQRFDAVDRIHVYETSDPEVIVTEHWLHGQVLATGERFSMPSIMVARVRNGLITWCRSYSSRLEAA